MLSSEITDLFVRTTDHSRYLNNSLIYTIHGTYFVVFFSQVQDLTPTLLTVLKIVHRDRDKDKGVCGDCSTNLDSLLSQALAPLSNAQDMHSASLPRNFHISTHSSASTDQIYAREWPPMQREWSDFKSPESNSTIFDRRGNKVKEDSSRSKGDSSQKHESLAASTAASFFIR